ncbi:MAG: glutaminyl-peptide cyclotransferase [Ornithinimicrobium sp.]
MRPLRCMSPLVLGAVLLAGCAGDATSFDSPQSGESSETAEVAEEAAAVEDTAVKAIEVEDIIEVIDREASFTQGVELLGDGTMVHSRGLYGESGIELLSPTGEVLGGAELPDDEFGEGVTVVPNEDWDEDWPDVGPLLTAYQLTWKSGVVHTWSLPDLVEGPSLHIDGEGWGLCYDDSREALWLSDGSSTLQLLSASDLTLLAEITVTEDTGVGSEEIDHLNELECVGGQVWANVWQSDDIVLIEPSEQDETGKVVLRLSLTDVVQAEGPADAANVLNGIAWDSADDSLLVTGKNWEHLYRISLGED